MAGGTKMTRRKLCEGCPYETNDRSSRPVGVDGSGRLQGAAAGGGPTATRGVRGGRHPAGRARLPGTRGPGEGLPGRRDPGPRRGLPRERQLPRGLDRQEGRPALRDRPQAARGDSRGDQGRPGHGPGPARKGEQRRRPLHAPRGEAGGEPAGARQREGRAGRVAVAGRGREGRGREGHARPLLYARHLARHRPRRHDGGEGRQSRGPR